MGGPFLSLVSVLGASRDLGGAQGGLDQALGRLGTAGYSGGTTGGTGTLEAGVRLADQGRRNAEDGLRVLEAAAAGAQEALLLLARGGELARQAGAGEAPGRVDAAALDTEYQALLGAVDALDAGAAFNGARVFGTDLTVAVGEAAALRVAVGRLDSRTLLGELRGGLGSPADAAAEAEGLARGLQRLAAFREELEAQRRRLAFVANALGIQAETVRAALQRLREAGQAGEVVALSKLQVIQRSGDGALGPARQSILRLLR